jgi:type I restriction enzyme S subunit
MNWNMVPLLEIADLHDSRRVPLNATERAKRKGNFPYYGANGLVDHVNNYIFDGEYVLLAEDGGNFDKPERGVAYEVSGKFWVNNHAHILKPRGEMAPRFLRCWLNAIDWMPYVGGTTRAKLTQAGMAQVSIPIPPPSEQRRIVEKIDALTGRTTRARHELERIPILIQKYREAILGAAFSGELTREWRNNHPRFRVGKLTSNSVIDARTPYLEQLPETWAWTALGNAASVGGGLTKNPKRDALHLKVHYLRVANVYANELRLDEIAQIGCTPTELSKTRLEAGDLLIVEGNGSIDQIGRVAMWSSEIENCSHQNHIIRARMNVGFEPKYALYWLISPEGRTAIERVASSSAGLHTLSITKVSSLPFPVCGITEQQEIVRRIETAFIWLDRVAAEHANASRLLPRLDQAILAKAFRGELVPQDPNDKPFEISADANAPSRRGRMKQASN